jgi:hypothetical protein
MSRFIINSENAASVACAWQLPYACAFQWEFQIGGASAYPEKCLLWIPLA